MRQFYVLLTRLLCTQRIGSSIYKDGSFCRLVLNHVDVALVDQVWIACAERLGERVMAEMASFGVSYKCSASNESFDEDLLVGGEKRCKINSFGSPDEYAGNRHE